MPVDDIKVVIKAEDKTSGVFSNLAKNTQGLQDSFSKLIKVVGVSMVGAFGALSALGVSSFKAFSEAEKEMVVANQALSNAFKQMSDKDIAKLTEQLGAGKDVFKELQSVMEETGKSAIQLGFDDESASVAFAKLFQVTGNVTQAQKDLKLAMDLAAYKTVDLETATLAVSKAHAGSTRELMALGFQLKDNATSADILATLQDKVGGTAEKMAATSGKQLEILGIQWQNLKEQIGGTLSEGLKPFIEKLNEFAKSEDAKKMAEALAIALKKISEVISDLAFDKLPKLIDKIKEIISWFEQHKEVTIGLATAIGIMLIPSLVGLATVLFTSVIPALFATAAAFIMANLPITIISVSIGLLVYAILNLIKHWDLIKAKTIEVWTAIKDFFIGIWESIKKTFDDAVKYIMDKIQPLLDALTKVKNAVSSAFTGFGNVSGKVLSAPGKLLGFQEGGIVPGPIGMPVPAIVHGGETVIPNGGGFGGVNIYITGTFLSEWAASEMAKKIMDELKMNIRI